jgi:hypothetical protein
LQLQQKVALDLLTMRQIFTQGDYDGACFLYALANAYTAVTGKAPSCDAWDTGIRSLRHRNDFLGGCIGTTEHFSSDPKTLKEAVAIMLASFNSDGPAVGWKDFPDVNTISEIASRIDLNGVVVFRYKGVTAHVADIDHWACGVAFTEKPFRLHLACSYRRTQDDRTHDKQYRERYHQQLGRYSNNWLDSRHGVKIFPGSVFRIWKAG